MKVAATQLPRASSASKKSQKDSSASLCPETKIAVSCRLSVQKPSQNASNRSNAFKFDNFGAETPSNRTTVSSRSSTRAPITHNYTLQKNTGLFVEGRPKVESVYTTHPEYKPTSRKSAVTVSTERGCAKANDVQTQSDLDYSEDSNRHSVRSKLKSIAETRNSEHSRSSISFQGTRNTKLNESNSRNLSNCNDAEMAFQAMDQKEPERKTVPSNGNMSSDPISWAHEQTQAEREEEAYQRRKNAIEANIKAIRKRSISDNKLSKNKPQSSKTDNQVSNKMNAILKNSQGVLSSQEILDVKTLLQMRLLSSKSCEGKSKSNSSFQKSRPVTPCPDNNVDKSGQFNLTMSLMKSPSREQVNRDKSLDQTKKTKSENKVNISDHKIQIEKLLKRSLFEDAQENTPSQTKKEEKVSGPEKPNVSARQVLGVKNMNVQEKEAKPELMASNQSRKHAETPSQKFFKSPTSTKSVASLSTPFTKTGDSSSKKLKISTPSSSTTTNKINGENAASNETSNVFKVNIRNQSKAGKENQNEKNELNCNKSTKIKDGKSAVAKDTGKSRNDLMLQERMSSPGASQPAYNGKINPSKRFFTRFSKEQSARHNSIQARNKESKIEQNTQKTPHKFLEKRSSSKDNFASKAKKFETEGRKSQQMLKDCSFTPRVSCISNLSERFSQNPKFFGQRNTVIQEENPMENNHQERLSVPQTMPARYSRAKSAPYNRASVTTEHTLQQPPRNTIERDRVPRTSARLVMQTVNRPDYGDLLQRVTVQRSRGQIEIPDALPAAKDPNFSELERDIQSTLHLFQDLDVIINHPEGQEHENASQRNTNWLTAEPQMVRNSIATRCSQKAQKSFSPRRSMPQESQLMLMKSNVVEEDLVVEEEAVDRLEYIKQRLTITKKLEAQNQKLEEINANLISPISKLSNLTDTFFRSENSSCQMMIPTHAKQLSTLEISHFISADTLPYQMNSIQEF